MAFEGFGQIYRAVAPLPALQDPVVRDALATLGPARLGFFGAPKTDAIEVAIRLLQEQGRAVNEDERLKIIAALKELDEVRRLRIKVSVQILVTLLVALIALAVIFGAVSASDDLKKVSYGLLGSAVGYWLK